MDVKKIQVIAFALRNRLLGYKLLPNPKGSSPYKIKMIKAWSGISHELDRFDNYHRKYRDYSKPDEKTQKITLRVTRYMFWKDKNDKKVVKEVFCYGRKSNGKPIEKEKKPELSYEETTNRDTSYIDELHITGYHKESNPLVACLGAVPAEHYVPTEESIAEKEIASFFRKKLNAKSQSKTKSFWSILRKNLANE